MLKNGVVVLHMLTVYVTVAFASSSNMLCTMLHGPTVPSLANSDLLLGDIIVVVDVVVDVALRKSITFTQKSFVPAAATDALQISSDVMRMLTIRNTGFSAARTYAMCQSFMFLHHRYLATY